MPVRHNAPYCQSLGLCEVRHASLEAEQLARITATGFIALEMQIQYCIPHLAN